MFKRIDCVDGCLKKKFMPQLCGIHVNRVHICDFLFVPPTQPCNTRMQFTDRGDDGDDGVVGSSSPSKARASVDTRESGSGGEIITLQFGPSANWLGRAFWELQDELIRPYGTGSCLQPHPSAVEVDRGVHFGGGTEEDKEWPRVLVFDAKKDTSLINLLRPQDRDASGQGQIPESYGIPNPYDNPYNNPYDFFQENVQSAVMSSMNSWGGAMERFDLAGAPPVPNSEGESAAQLTQTQAEAIIRSTQPPRHWAEGWAARLHTKSLYELKTVKEETPFDVWSYGHEIMASEDDKEAYLEGLRFQLEHTDRVQGFQVFVDIDSGFGGFAHQYLEEVRMECRSANIYTYGLTPKSWGASGQSKGGHFLYSSSAVADRKAKMNVNVALGVANLSAASNVYIPLSLGGPWEKECQKWLTYDPDVRHHMFCMLGLAVDTVSLPFRLAHRGRFDMTSAFNALAHDSRRRIAALSMAAPVGGKYSESLVGGVERSFATTKTLEAQNAQTLDELFASSTVVEDWGRFNPAHQQRVTCSMFPSAVERVADENSNPRRRMSYGMLGSLRGYADSYNRDGSPGLALVKQLARSRCDPRRIMGYSTSCPGVFPEKFYPHRLTREELEQNEEDDDVENKKGEEEENSRQYQRFMSCMTVLRSSNDMLPVLQATLGGLKNRPGRIMFEYEKGTNGLTQDDFAEIEQQLYSIVEAFTED